MLSKSHDLGARLVTIIMHVTARLDLGCKDQSDY